MQLFLRNVLHRTLKTTDSGYGAREYIFTHIQKVLDTSAEESSNRKRSSRKHDTN